MLPTRQVGSKIEQHFTHDVQDSHGLDVPVMHTPWHRMLRAAVLCCWCRPAQALLLLLLLMTAKHAATSD
jgi:hypothetical protein